MLGGNYAKGLTPSVIITLGVNLEQVSGKTREARNSDSAGHYPHAKTSKLPDENLTKLYRMTLTLQRNISAGELCAILFADWVVTVDHPATYNGL